MGRKTKLIDKLDTVVIELWVAIEDGTVSENFFELREKVRDVRTDVGVYLNEREARKSR